MLISAGYVVVCGWKYWSNVSRVFTAESWWRCYLAWTKKTP